MNGGSEGAREREIEVCKPGGLGRGQLFGCRQTKLIGSGLLCECQWRDLGTQHWASLPGFNRSEQL